MLLATTIASDFTYRTNTTCTISFCNAFFENNSICEVETETGRGYVSEEDGVCEIRIVDSQVSCALQCNPDTPNMLEDIVIYILISISVIFCFLITWIKCGYGKRISKREREEAEAEEILSAML